MYLYNDKYGYLYNKKIIIQIIEIWIFFCDVASMTFIFYTSRFLNTNVQREAWSISTPADFALTDLYFKIWICKYLLYDEYQPKDSPKFGNSINLILLRINYCLTIASPKLPSKSTDTDRHVD